jgi:hypothetical protein
VRRKGRDVRGQAQRQDRVEMVPETGSRIYQRLATVFDAAVIEGLRRENPATPIRRELTKRAGRRERTNFALMPYQEAPAFIKRLRKAPGNAARCLEFAILTAAHSRGAHRGVARARQRAADLDDPAGENEVPRAARGVSDRPRARDSGRPAKGNLVIPYRHANPCP